MPYIWGALHVKMEELVLKHCGPTKTPTHTHTISTGRCQTYYYEDLYLIERADSLFEIQSMIFIPL